MGVTDAVHLDADDMFYLKDAFSDGGGELRKRIGLEEVLKCVEEMDFVIDGELSDLVRSVVPAAAEAGEFSLDDAIKVAQAAKEAAGDDDLPEVRGLERDSSLADLERSFHQQQEAGDIPEAVHLSVPGVPDTIEEADVDNFSAAEDVDGSNHSRTSHVSNLSGIDVGSPHPMIQSMPHQRRRSIAVEVPTLRVVPDTVRRTESLMVLQHKYPNAEGPEPKQDDLPRRRMSVTGSSNGRLMEGLETVAGAIEVSPSGPLDTLTKPDPEEEALLATASFLSPDPVEESDLPRKRESRNLPEHMDIGDLLEHERRVIMEAEIEACLESLKAAVERHCTFSRAIEEADGRAADAWARVELLKDAAIRVDIEASLTSLVDSIERDALVARAKVEAQRVTMQAAARISEEAAARLAAEQEAAELVEAATIRVDVEGALRNLIESIDRDAALAQVKQEAERVAAEAVARVTEEAAARLAAEEKAAELIEAANIRVGVEAVVIGLIEAVERDAAIAQVKEEAERAAAEAATRVREEIVARLTAEEKAAELVEAAKRRVDVEASLMSLIETIERDAAIAQARQEAEGVAAEAAARSAEEASVRIQEEAAARAVAEEKASEALRLVAAAAEEATKKAQAAEETEADRLARLQEEEDARYEAEARAKQFEEEMKNEHAARSALEEQARVLVFQLEAMGSEADARIAALQRERGETEARMREEYFAREEAELKVREWKEKFEAKAKEWEEKEAEERERVAKEAEAEQKDRLAEAVDAAARVDTEQDREAQAKKKGVSSRDGYVSNEEIGRSAWGCFLCTANAQLHNADGMESDASVGGVKNANASTSSRQSDARDQYPKLRAVDVCAVM